MKKLAAKEIKTITTAIQRYYFHHDSPPPRRVSVPPASIRQSTKQPDLFSASVEIECDYIPKNPRVHWVDIRFRIHGGSLDPRTLGYIAMP